MRRAGEQGSVSSLFLVVCWTLILVGLVIGADFGRLYFYREQVQTAADAAALAGAVQVRRMVRVRVDGRTLWVARECTAAEEAAGKTDCSGEVDAPQGVVEGEYPQNWRLTLCVGGYRCPESVTVRYECWLEPKPGDWGQISAVARAVFVANAQGTQWEPYVRLPDPVVPPRPLPQESQGWGWFFVEVRPVVEVPTFLWSALGKSSMRLEAASGAESPWMVARATPTLRGNVEADVLRQCGGL